MWIITDGAVKTPGIGATLYVTRNNKLQLAGFFSAKLRGRQITRLPCEKEVLSIAARDKTLQPLHHSVEHQLVSSLTANLVYSPSKSYVVVNSPQAPMLQFSSLPSLDTKVLFVMLLALRSYLLTLLVLMLPNVTTQLAKFAASSNALRIPWFSKHLSIAYCRELLNFLSLAELLGLLGGVSRPTVHSCPSYARHTPFQEFDKH